MYGWWSVFRGAPASPVTGCHTIYTKEYVLYSTNTNLRRPGQGLAQLGVNSTTAGVISFLKFSHQVIMSVALCAVSHPRPGALWDRTAVGGTRPAPRMAEFWTDTQDLLQGGEPLVRKPKVRRTASRWGKGKGKGKGGGVARD